MTQTDPSAGPTGPTGPTDPGLLAAVHRVLPNPLIVLDARGRVVLWNAAAELLLGMPAHDVLGEELAALVLPAAAEWLPLVAETRATGVARRSVALEVASPAGRATLAGVQCDAVAPG